MKFSISREALLKPLNLVAGVVERRQTLPILSNVMLSLDGDLLSITGTDLEVELVGRVSLDKNSQPGEVTVPARKLVDICKSLPDDSQIEFSVKNQKATIKSGRSRFTLVTLPASEFPAVEEGPGSASFKLAPGQIKRLIDKTAFAMAQQDVRYYLNGMLWEVAEGSLKTVSTDGHRLALCTLEEPSIKVGALSQLIVPRKGVLELAKLLGNCDSDVELVFGANHIQAVTPEFTFTSKLVDGKFPEYDRVLPKGGSNSLLAPRDELRQALSRAAILSNEKYRGIRLVLEENSMQITANNPEQEEAEAGLSVEYNGDSMEIGFNVSYLLDITNVIDDDKVKFTLSDSNSSALLEEPVDSDALYVVMPMRL